MFGFDDIFNTIYNNVAADNRAELATHNNALLAKENRDWQEKMQREQWSRDDSQYQRMVNDMSAAGLNPLSGSSPSSSGLSVSGAQASAVMANPSPSNFSLDGLFKVLGFQEQLNLQEKRINLDAIRSGVSPSSLGGNDKDIVKLFNDIAQNNLKILRKEANSPYSRSEGSFEKTYKGVKNVFNDVNDYVFANTGHSLNEIPKSVKGVKVVDSKNTSEYKKDVEQYYKDKAFGSNNNDNPLRRLRRWIRASRASR